jgi:hypothetical protein
MTGNGTGANSVCCYVSILLIADKAVFGLRRRGAGRWGVPVAASLAVAVAVGVSAALIVSRVAHGTAADGAWLTVASDHLARLAASVPAGGR